MARPIKEIAREIARDIRGEGGPPNHGTVPYLGAMHGLDKLTDRYGTYAGDHVVVHFLAGSVHWRGEVASRVREELSAMLKDK